jgi:hypothetical protein
LGSLAGGGISEILPQRRSGLALARVLLAPGAFLAKLTHNSLRRIGHSNKRLIRDRLAARHSVGQVARAQKIGGCDLDEFTFGFGRLAAKVGGQVVDQSL